MKELSIEEKARRYDEALKVLHKYDGANIMFSQSLKEEMFPELKESEDERAWRELIEGFKRYDDGALFNGCLVRDIIAWLEKQGEHARFIEAIQIGDQVTKNEDGVLVNLSQLNRVAKKDEKQGEQTPVIEIKTPEESLGIDSDTYNKIVDECVYGEQKPAWSEEDETGLTNTIILLKEGASLHFNKKDITKAVDWLKSLKDRVQPQPKQEWREEDERIRIETIELLETANHPNKIRSNGKPLDFTENINWLKSLRPQTTWKPSDEQMELIKDIVFKDRQKITRKELAIFHSIYNDLKKLREEQV